MSVETTPVGRRSGLPPHTRPPRLPPLTLVRPRLRALLTTPPTCDGDRGTVTVVAGAAGAGKTTVLAGWAQHLLEQGAAVAWVGVGPDDDDPVALFAVLLGALLGALRAAPGDPAEPTQPAQSTASADRHDYTGPHDSTGSAGTADTEPIDPLWALTASGPPDEPAAGLARRIGEAVAAVDAELRLFVDDAHLLRHRGCVELLDELVRWAPANLHVVLGTRETLPVRTGRLRVEGRLVQVRDHDLRFTVEETTALMALHQRAVAPEQVARLHRLTEGWAAGIGLAAVSLAIERDVDTFLRTFAGDEGPMTAYLVDEVLGTLPDDRRDFLLATCVADRVTVELAARLAARDDAGVVLRELAATHSLVEPVAEGHETTYRYHPLLRSHLRTRLRAASLERAASMHAESASWFAEQGAAAETVEHAVASRVDGLARSALHRYAVQLLLDGRARLLDDALAALPGAVLTDPALAALRALAGLDLGDLTGAQTWLAVADDLLGDDVARRSAKGSPAVLSGLPTRPSGDVAGTSTAVVPLPARRLVAVARAHASRIAGAPRPARDQPGTTPAGPAAASLPAEGGSPALNLRHLELLEAIDAAYEHVRRGRLPDSARAFTAALAQARRGGHDLAALTCLGGLTAVAASAGDLVTMRAHAREAIAWARHRGRPGCAALLLPYAAAADEAHERYDLPLAKQLVDEAMLLLDGRGRPDGADAGADDGRPDVSPSTRRIVQSVAAYVDFAVAQGDPVAQRELASTRAEVVARLPVEGVSPTLLAFELSGQHRMALLSGQLDLAEAVESIAAGVPELSNDLHVLRALHALRVGRDDDARKLAALVVRGQLEPLVVGGCVAAHLVEVTVAVRRGQPAVAHDSLLTALDLAAAQGGLRMMLHVSAEVVGALRQALGRFGRHEPFVERLLQVADELQASGVWSRSQQTPGAGAAPLLSPRELSLLRDLPSLLTVAEIAQARSVSPNTVKTQLRSLFEKLEVSTRRGAVAAGRREGLI